MTGQLISFPGKHKAEIPTLDLIMAEYETRITHALLDPTTPEGDQTLNYIGHMMALACDARSKSTYDSLFEFVAIAHGLHAGARALRPTNPGYADEMMEAGQLFLSYAVGDIGCMMSKTGAEVLGLH
jgi:hypothetical protein